MNANDLFEQRNSYFLSPNSTVKGGITLCLVLAALALVAGSLYLESQRVWGAFLLNLFFFFREYLDL